jgi:hypothetical protein
MELEPSISDVTGKRRRPGNWAFPLVTIHREEVEPQGVLDRPRTRREHGGVSLLEIGPDPIWEDTPQEYRIKEIARLNFGGDYENAGTPRGR